MTVTIHTDMTQLHIEQGSINVSFTLSNYSSAGGPLSRPNLTEIAIKEKENVEGDGREVGTCD